MMSGLEMGITGFLILLTLLLIRVHISISMFLAAAGLYIYLGQGDLNNLMYTLNGLAYARLSNYDLAVVPLFILMGQFASNGGLSKSLFQAASSFIGHWRGGLAMAATGSCAAFGAICGSSLATAATMGQVAIPELKKHNYSPGSRTDVRKSAVCSSIEVSSEGIADFYRLFSCHHQYLRWMGKPNGVCIYWCGSLWNYRLAFGRFEMARSH